MSMLTGWPDFMRVSALYSHGFFANTQSSDSNGQTPQDRFPVCVVGGNPPTSTIGSFPVSFWLVESPLQRSAPAEIEQVEGKRSTKGRPPRTANHGNVHRSGKPFRNLLSGRRLDAAGSHRGPQPPVGGISPPERPVQKAVAPPYARMRTIASAPRSWVEYIFDCKRCAAGAPLRSLGCGVRLGLEEAGGAELLKHRPTPECR